MTYATPYKNHDKYGYFPLCIIKSLKCTPCVVTLIVNHIQLNDHS